MASANVQLDVDAFRARVLQCVRDRLEPDAQEMVLTLGIESSRKAHNADTSATTPALEAIP